MNSKTLTIISTGSLLAVMMMLTACATTGSSPEIISTEIFNPVEEITKLNDEITAARQAQVNILSPESFAQAERYYNDSKSGLENGYKLSRVKSYVEKSRAALIRAKEATEIAKATIPDVIEGRKTARAAGATKLGEDYTQIEKLFLQLTRAVEKEDLSYAQRYKSRVLDGYWDLEIRAIKESTIGETRRLIDAAQKADAPEILPNLYMQAESKLKQTDQFISNNPYDKETMAKMGAEALFLAKRTNILTKQAKIIEEMRPEEIALWMEKIMYKMSSQLNAPDMRDQKFNTQVDNVIGYIKSLDNERQIFQDKVKAQQAQLSAQKKRIVRLEAIAKEQQTASEKLAEERRAAEQRLEEQKKFNQLFEEVQNIFDKDEAEVYKKGSQCIIRLRAIRFPVGKAVIMPNNYGLLSKVQQAIHKFDDPRVIIEGHTDNTGSNDVNELLSQQRAESVRQYLVGNGFLDDETIMAVGYGSTQPLADNNTEEGRAINRRIDVIVTPHSEEENVQESTSKNEIQENLEQEDSALLTQ
jgi:outer membrane protein OmpA-like peptidoglycan-associated protein